MKDNVVLGKAFYFAERIYKLHRYLMLEKKSTSLPDRFSVVALL